MVIKYSFLDNTTSEVEVDDELGKHITEMDEADYNLNRKETRRHDYISELEEKGRYITDDSDPLEDVLKEERIKELMAAKRVVDPRVLEQGAPKGYRCRGRRVTAGDSKPYENNFKKIKKIF